MKLPVYVEQLLAVFDAQDIEAYLVGGCVRDFLMGRVPHDYDIATAATPDKVRAMFPRTIPTGLRHGTVTVLTEGGPVEVTTFRQDGAYQDNRRPESVAFVSSVEADLARRDFTVNAMAYHPKKGLVDPFGGREDLAKKCLRTVGEAALRFEEDALRMLRAVRFAAQLDFSVTEDTCRGIRRHAALLQRVSAERIREELQKILVSAHPEKVELLHDLGLLVQCLPEVDRLFATEQHTPYHAYDVGHHTMLVLQHVAPKPVLRLAALLHDCGKPLCKTTDGAGRDHFYGHGTKSRQLAEAVLRRLKYDNKTIDAVCRLIYWHDRRFADDAVRLRESIAQIGPACMEDLLALQQADVYGKNPANMEQMQAKIRQKKEKIEEILQQPVPWQQKDLALGGNDLAAMGLSGKQIGEILAGLHKQCIQNPAMNSRNSLWNLVQNKTTGTMEGSFLKSITIKPGIRMHFIPDPKFKTFAMGAFIHCPLNREDATKNALLPSVLKRGSAQYPSAKAVSKALEELYGASMGTNVSKLGEMQILSFYMEAVNEALVPAGEGFLKQAITLFFDILLHPLTENGAFRADYVEQEKVNLKDYIESIINDKRSYAVERCVEEMCAGEAYGISDAGYVADLGGIDPAGLYSYYQKVLAESPIDIFFAGNFDETAAAAATEKQLADLPQRSGKYPATELIKQVGEVKTVRQTMPVNQGKLTLGYRTGMEPTAQNYYSLIIYNSIFGSGTHSKLFNNVREKLSLAYYASSRLEKHKGLMLVSSGIEFENYQKALDEILLQESEMKKGNISDREITFARMSVANALRSYKDSTRYLIDYYHGQVLLGTDISLDEAIEKCMAVSIEDVVAVAQNVSLDTVYFLTGEGDAQ